MSNRNNKNTEGVLSKQATENQFFKKNKIFFKKTSFFILKLSRALNNRFSPCFFALQSLFIGKSIKYRVKYKNALKGK